MDTVGRGRWKEEEEEEENEEEKEEEEEEGPVGWLSGKRSLSPRLKI